jgi:hypothetical protein
MALSRREALALGTLRAVVTIVVIVTLYYVLPLRGVHGLSDVWVVVGGVAAFTALAVWQVRSIRDADFPVLRAVQALALIISLFLVSFAATYYEMEAADASSFSSELTRTDSLYFCVTVFATVGFGDIVPRTETARVLVTVQMIGDLVIIGALIRAAGVITQQARLQRNDKGSTS